METINNFLHVYLYQLEDELNKDCAGLDKVKFQSEEANTDEEAKVFFKSYILSHPNIKKDVIKKLIIKRGEKPNEVEIGVLSNYKISNVILPKELTDEMRKAIASSKHSVYTNPDLYLEITDGNGQKNYVTIELKTTKTNQIPGSSVQQIAPYEWVIFVKHTDDGEITVTCGCYINSITEKLPFPDRSPRPIIAFDTLQKWNAKNRKLNGENLEYSFDEEIEKKKEGILKNWEMVLCNEWLDTITKESRSSEKWFNNTIRMYTLKLLLAIKKNPDLLDKLISKLSKNIKKG